MYVIHAVSRLPIVPKHLGELFKAHLAWVGRVMGIGQAGLLADVSIYLVYIEDGERGDFS